MHGEDRVDLGDEVLGVALHDEAAEHVDPRPEPAVEPRADQPAHPLAGHRRHALRRARPAAHSPSSSRRHSWCRHAVHASTRPRTRSPWRTATICEITPPIDAPITCAVSTSSASSTDDRVARHLLEVERMRRVGRPAHATVVERDAAVAPPERDALERPPARVGAEALDQQQRDAVLLAEGVVRDQRAVGRGHVLHVVLPAAIVAASGRSRTCAPARRARRRRAGRRARCPRVGTAPRPPSRSTAGPGGPTGPPGRTATGSSGKPSVAPITARGASPAPGAAKRHGQRRGRRGDRPAAPRRRHRRGDPRHRACARPRRAAAGWACRRAGAAGRPSAAPRPRARTARRTPVRGWRPASAAPSTGIRSPPSTRTGMRPTTGASTKSWRCGSPPNSSTA